MLLPALLLLAGQAGDPLAGEWRGTSLCQVRPSPCTDEIAVYHIARGAGPAYHIVANKVVGGVEGPMGEIDMTWDAATHRLVGVTYDRRKRPGRWVFELDSDKLHGTLTSEDGVTLRKIELTRFSS